MSDTKEDLQHLDTNSGDSSQIDRRTSDIADNVEPTEAELLASYVPGTEEEKKLVRKIDLYLLPILWVMYILNYVDRTNIGNARIAGMEEDLELNDDRFAWVLSIFFFGYLICEVPSNMILSRSKPSLFLPGIMLVWGIVSCVMALSKSYGVMLVFRFVLGCIEAGFFPGVLFLLSSWYTTAESGRRFAAFYTAAVISGAFGGLIAGAITGNLHDARGIAGWRWLFIIEGAATVFTAIVAKFILLDFPSTSNHLTPRERQLATARILYDGIATGQKDRKNRLNHKEAFFATVLDYRVYLFLLLFVMVAGAGTISYFIPTITKTLGFSSVHAQYMTIPVYVVAAISLNLVAWSADKRMDRRWHITGSMFVGFVAAIITLAVLKPAVRYVFLCLVASGIYSALPLVLVWTSETINLPAEKRAIALAMVNAFGNLASVYGSRIWPSWDGPGYRIGWGVTAGFLIFGSVLAAIIPVVIKKFPWKGTKAEQELEAPKRAQTEASRMPATRSTEPVAEMEA
ncbi:major facilitator superfamily transporter [Ascobolus immersus RN42]|uniref:Major facilitator superfamily transporter n=1 Tax=Ascobolus immersus RN42 TaxID=1160509 RepID=A0A3N4INR4_ASCIM|nr:major facilitator superfamily transporter [Ascobolus immersus RN42]